MDLVTMERENALTRYRDGQVTDEAYHASGGDNPHACYDPASTYHTPDPIPAPNWRTEPEGFITYHKGAGVSSIESMLSGVVAALESVDWETPESANALWLDCECVISLLGTLSERIPTWDRPGSQAFLEFGPILVPTSPLGLRVLGFLRRHAQNAIDGRNMVEIAEQGSVLGKLAAALDGCGERSAILQGVRNHTSANGKGFALALALDARALASMPSGEALPVSILVPDVEGYEIDGDDALRLINDCDMCHEGAIEFLQKHEIGFETEGGSYECDSCGRESDDEDSAYVSSIDDFTFTADMVLDLDGHGFLSDTRDFIGEADGSADWNSLLDIRIDAEIMERHKPAENGIEYDPDVWAFVPDFESIEGLAELEWSEQVRILPLLSRIVSEHESARMLPPIEGTLTLKPSHAGEGNARMRARAFAWDPDAGTLTHRTQGGSTCVAVVVQTTDPYSSRVSLRFDGHTVPLEAGGGGWRMQHTPDAGERAHRLLHILQGSVRL